ncbi:MAG: acyltransferase family protein [Deltaproteobacteria bacterium]|nr:acyltransferase family protein [Deltaproteobacteria bacterium]
MKTNNNKITNSCYLGADGFRAIACLAILFHHIAVRLYEFRLSETAYEIRAFALLGQCAISAFLVLSGFLLARPFFNAYLNDGALPSIKQYFIKRAGRIMPGFYLAIIVSTIVMFFSLPKLQYVLPRFLAGVTFTSSFHYTTFFPVDFVNQPLWTISIVVFCSILLPIIMMLLFRFGKKRSFSKVLLVWLAIEVLILVFNRLIHQYLTPDNLKRGAEFGMAGYAKLLMPNINPVALFAHFSIGVIAAAIAIKLTNINHLNKKVLSKKVADFISTILIVVIAILLWNLRHTETFSFSLQQQPYFFPVLTILFAVLLIFIGRSGVVGKLLDNKFFRFTAKISFGLYLWHHLVSYLIVHYYLHTYYEIGVRDYKLWVTASLILLITSYIIATLLYYFFERKFIIKAALFNKTPPIIKERRLPINLAQLIIVIIITILAIIFVLPLLWMFDASLRPPLEVLQTPPAILQKPIWQFADSYTRDSYLASFMYWDTGRALMNSLIISITTVILTSIVCSLYAYALVFIKARTKTIFFIMAIIIIMLPTSAHIVAYYRLMNELHLINNWFGLILPASVSGIGVFLLRQYFIKLPISVVESAKLEGASHLRIWWHIVLPLARPALAALAIIQFRFAWNDFLMPMIVLRDDNMFTLPLKIGLIGDPGALAATSFIALVIPLALFIKFHRKFMETLASGLSG